LSLVIVIERIARALGSERSVPSLPLLNFHSRKNALGAPFDKFFTKVDLFVLAALGAIPPVDRGPSAHSRTG
jgi:hypothetical protein